MTDASSDYLETLSQAVAAFLGQTQQRPPARQVVAALLQAEKAAKSERLTYPLEDLKGKWRLCFTASRTAHEKSGVVQGRGWYMPKFFPAYISFHPTMASRVDGVIDGEIENQIQFGPALFKLNGPLRYPGKKNLLAFDFTQAEFSLLSKALYKGGFRSGKTQSASFEHQPISQLPFFAFFLVTPTFIAARGRGGGLAIWVDDQPIG